MKRVSLAAILLTISSLDATMVQRKEFFQIAVGEDETAFQTEYAKNPLKYFMPNASKPKQSGLLVTLDHNYTVERAADFEQLSIGDLRTKSESMLTIPVGGGTFSVIEAQKPSGTAYLKFVDVGALQENPKYRDATFQVASNFNALELTSKNDQMKDISGYIYDKTQGPFASISAPYGLIFRHYYMFFDTKPAGEWSQTPQRQINFLDKTDIPVTNSYVDFSKKAPDQVVNYAVENIKIGLHKNLQVLFGYMPDTTQFERVTDNQQVVNQVFTAAVDFKSNTAFKNNAKAVEIAQNILNAAYEGTIRAAFIDYQEKVSDRKLKGITGDILPNNKVVLTLVGGGVFNNNFDWIAEAIIKNKDFIVRSGMQVELVIYDSSNQAMLGFPEKMKKLVQETGGYYKRYWSKYPQGEDIVVAKGAATSGTKTALDAALTGLQKALNTLATALRK